MHLRIRYKRLGGHVHMRLFTAPHADHTHAKIGDLCVSLDEWLYFMEMFAQHKEITLVDEIDGQPVQYKTIR